MDLNKKRIYAGLRFDGKRDGVWTIYHLYRTSPGAVMIYPEGAYTPTVYQSFSIGMSILEFLTIIGPMFDMVRYISEVSK